MIVIVSFICILGWATVKPGCLVISVKVFCLDEI